MIGLIIWIHARDREKTPVTNGAAPGAITGTRRGRTWVFRARVLFYRHEWLRGYTLLSPTLMVMICALAFPIFALFVYSFWSQNYVDIDQTFTLKNYETFFEKGISCRGPRD